MGVSGKVMLAMTLEGRGVEDGMAKAVERDTTTEMIKKLKVSMLKGLL